MWLPSGGYTQQFAADISEHLNTNSILHIYCDEAYHRVYTYIVQQTVTISQRSIVHPVDTKEDAQEERIRTRKISYPAFETVI